MSDAVSTFLNAQEPLPKGMYRPVVERIMKNRDAVKMSKDSRQQRRARARERGKMESRYKKLSAKMDRKIIELRKQGYSCAAIAQRFSVSATLVSVVCVGAGL